MKLLVNAVILAALACAAPALAADYPDRPVRVVVPYAAGGPADILARLIGQRLGARLGQQLVIENKPGAGGGIGAAQVARSPADGYTLLVAPVGVMAINPWIYSNLGYDPLRDFQPVTLLAKSPFLLTVNPNVPARSVAEFVAYAKANPGKVKIANAGIGTGQHLAAVYFSTVAGINTVQVPYRGSALGTNDLLAGTVDAQFDLAPLLPHIAAGKLRPLGATSPKRIASMPDIPTIAESGFAGFEMEAWNGLVAPAGTPRVIVDKLQKEIAAVLAEPDLSKQLRDQGYEPGGNTADEFAAFARKELEKYRGIAKDAQVPKTD